MSEQMSLAEEFSAAAERYKKDKDDVTLPLLLAQFSILMRHKLTDPSDKDAVTATLFDWGMDVVTRKIIGSKPTFSLEDPQTEMSEIFSQVLLPQYKNHIPPHAAADLADATLDIIRSGQEASHENVRDRSGNPNWELADKYKEALAAAAGITLSFADQFNAVIQTSNANVTTNNPVVASRPIVLTRANSPASAS